MKVISGIYQGVTTSELDTLAAETAACMTTQHPDYAILAARIAVSNLHKETKKLFTSKWLMIKYRERERESVCVCVCVWVCVGVSLLHVYVHVHIFHFVAVMQDLFTYVNPKNKRQCPMISKEINAIIQKNADVRRGLYGWSF